VFVTFGAVLAPFLSSFLDGALVQHVRRSGLTFMTTQ